MVNDRREAEDHDDAVDGDSKTTEDDEAAGFDQRDREQGDSERDAGPADVSLGGIGHGKQERESDHNRSDEIEATEGKTLPVVFHNWVEEPGMIGPMNSLRRDQAVGPVGVSLASFRVMRTSILRRPR